MGPHRDGSARSAFETFHLPADPTYGGRFEGGISRQVGQGDVIIVPPGTVHQWASVGPSQMLAYFIVRIDPEHKQAAGAVNAALKKK